MQYKQYKVVTLDVNGLTSPIKRNYYQRQKKKWPILYFGRKRTLVERKKLGFRYTYY